MNIYDRSTQTTDKKMPPTSDPHSTAQIASTPTTPTLAQPTIEQRPHSLWNRLCHRLLVSKNHWGNTLASLFKGDPIDTDWLERIKEQLLLADVGLETTTKIIQQFQQKIKETRPQNTRQCATQFNILLTQILQQVEKPLVIDQRKPYVFLIVGVNGVGKTTTIGKLAYWFQRSGKSVLLAAGDTFRAAAIDQLRILSEKNCIPVVARPCGADAASVIFDALQSAKKRQIDLLIADTAGRLHNKHDLMGELQKIVRVIKKWDQQAPHEIMLILDASMGQNIIQQTQLFHQALGLTGITITKLDGTAKGGTIFALADQFKIPIRFIGVGEQADDLQPFNAQAFTTSLLPMENGDLVHY